MDFAGVQARGDDVEFPGLHPFGKDWAVIDSDAFTLLFLQNEINHRYARSGGDVGV